jgi:hypothetical protein
MDVGSQEDKCLQAIPLWTQDLKSTLQSTPGSMDVCKLVRERQSEKSKKGKWKKEKKREEITKITITLIIIIITRFQSED